jgi:phospholipid/cholesterol/gamma-HCH transport system substrate-binding protein
MSARAARASIRKDSRFFINMAGIIGERYVEISPGSAAPAELAAESRVRGEDPPRIDQLLSQGYGVFGKVQEFLEANELVISEFLDQAKGVMNEANAFLKRKDRQKIFQLLENLVVITDDMKGFTQTLKDDKSRRFFDQLLDLVARAHGIDKETLKKFLQEEGIRARIF